MAQGTQLAQLSQITITIEGAGACKVITCDSTYPLSLVNLVHSLILETLADNLHNVAPYVTLFKDVNNVA